MEGMHNTTAAMNPAEAIDPEEVICRICLNFDVKMYSLDGFGLETYYEEILGVTLCKEEALPNWACFECAALLQKHHNLRMRCLKAQAILLEIVCQSQNSKVKIADVKLVNRYTEHLTSNLTKWENNENVDIFTCSDENPELMSVKIEAQEVLANDYEDLKPDIDSSEHDYDVPLEIEIKPHLIKQSVEKESMIKKKVRKINKTKFKPVKPPKKPISVMPKKIMKNLSNEESIKPTRPDAFLTQKLRGQKVDEAFWRIEYLTEEQQEIAFRNLANQQRYVNAKHKCPTCFRGFQNENRYIVHLTKHTEAAGQYECPFCHLRWRKPAKVRAHVKVHQLKYHCKRCPFTTSHKVMVLSHNRYHGGDTFSCEHCQETFRHRTSYLTHVRLVHRSEWLCAICGEAFVNDRGLQIHERASHRQEERDALEKAVSSGASVLCEPCRTHFLDQAAFDKHLMAAINHDMPEESSSKNTRSDWEKSNGKLRKSNSDRDTDGGVRGKGRGRGARRGERSNAPVHCEHCGQLFPSGSEYRKHYKATHPGLPHAKTYMCHECGTMTSDKGNLSIHMRVHRTERPYHCPEPGCTMSFKLASNMQRHRITHTGARPFACDWPMCLKRFTQSSSLASHVKHVHLKVPAPRRDRRPKAPQESPAVITLYNDGHDSM